MEIVLLIVLGLLLGSLIEALVWRTREYPRAKNKRQRRELSMWRGRSMCPHCRHQLKAVDLVPLISWVSLKGRCRYCRRPIGWHSIVLELVTALLLLVSYQHWPYQLHTSLDYVIFASWVFNLVILIALALYDIRWMELPTRLMYCLGAGAILLTALLTVSVENKGEFVISAAIGGVGLGGFFWLLYQISGGKWIGGGDVRLGFIMGGLLGWQRAVLALTLAAYLGTILIAVLALLGRYHRRLKVPFGPLLIAGLYLAFLWGQSLVDWYMGLAGY